MTTDIGLRVRERMRELLPDRKQEEVAGQIDMTPDAFSRALNGKRGFAAIELANLAEVLDTSMYWLATGEPDPFEVKLAARHKFDHGTQSRVPFDREGTAALVRDVTLAYGQVFGAKEVARSVKTLTPAVIRARLGDDFAAAFADRVEQTLAVDVVRVPDLSEALTLRFHSHRVIVIGQTPNWFYQNWSVAHELGHIVLDHEDQTGMPASGIDRQEADASAFAAELLLPAEQLRGIDWATCSPSAVAQLVWDWGVSTNALNRRLGKLKIEISPEISDLLNLSTQALLRRHWAGKAGLVDQITYRMEQANQRRFPQRLLSAHIDAIAAGRAPKATLAWMLGTPEEALEVDEPTRASIDVDQLGALLGLTPSS